MSVDELMERARPLAKGGVPSKSAVQKSLGVGWDKAKQVHEALVSEASEAARRRAFERRSKLRRSAIQETPVRRLRAPRATLLDVPTSPAVEPRPAPEITQVGPVADEVAQPFTTVFPIPSATPPATVVPPVEPKPVGRDREEVAPLPVAPSPAPSGTPRKPVATWPLLLLALPAFVAIWSGWVDLGRLTGFGVVHPFPGIPVIDAVSLNTAITLPIGLETYAAYGLYVWLGSGAFGLARRFAMGSAIGSLCLGAAGQVAYHLMVAAGMDRAPWQITTIVACLPVAVLGMGAALRHLVHAEQETDR